MSRLERRDLFALAPGVLAMVLFVAHGLLEGGHPPTIWYPTAIALLALLAAVLLGGRRLTLPFPLALAVACFGAFTLWGFLTIAWADDRAIALEGSAKTLLYLTAFALFAILPWTRASALVVVSLFTLGTAAAVSGLFLLSDVQEPSDRPFLFGRFADPVGYPNGNAALLLCACWPALVLAARREVHPALRGALLAAAGGLLELVVATQSRGAIAAAAATFAFALVVAPGRLRLVAALVPVGAATALTASRFLKLGELDLTDAELRAALGDARTVYVLSLVVLLALGLAVAYAERPFRRGPAGTRSRRVLAVGLVGLGIVVVAGGALGYPALRDRIDDARSGVQTSRFSDRQVDGGRMELWRVGLQEFERHPVLGIGVDNFAVPYAQERRVDDEEPLYPHSLGVRVLSQTGLIGLMLFLGFLAGAGWAVLRASRAGTETRALALAASLPALYWLVHGSLDWLWELPGLSVPVLGLAALAGRLEPEHRGRVVELDRSVTYAALAACALAAVALVPFWLSARDVSIAGREWRDDAPAAFARLDRAATLNPLSDVPAATAGAIASRRRDFAAMASRYEDALERSPDNWYSHLQLAVAYSHTGRLGAARAEVRRARELNPLERVLIQVQRQLAQGKRPDPRALDRYFLRQAGDLIR